MNNNKRYVGMDVKSVNLGTNNEGDWLYTINFKDGAHCEMYLRTLTYEHIRDMRCGVQRWIDRNVEYFNDSCVIHQPKPEPEPDYTHGIKLRLGDETIIISLNAETMKTQVVSSEYCVMNGIKFQPIRGGIEEYSLKWDNHLEVGDNAYGINSEEQAGVYKTRFKEMAQKYIRLTNQFLNLHWK